MQTKIPAPRGEVGLRDLALALASVRPETDAHLRILSRCLGLQGLSLPQAGTPKTAAGPQMRHRSPQQPPSQPVRDGRLPPARTLPPGPAKTRFSTELLELPPVDPDTAELPAWLTDPSPIPRPTPGPAREPLFPKITAAGILGAAIATLCDGSRPDIRRLVAHTVSGRPYRSLPRLPAPTRARGVQLLLDRGVSMTPFFPDQVDLERAFIHVAGAPQCEVFEFVDDPAHAQGYGPGDSLRPWRAVAGRPVVVVSDFGASGPDLSARVSSASWRRFASHLAEIGCPLLAVVPLPPRALPRFVARYFIALHWDRRTRAEHVRAQVGPGHEVKS